MKPRGGHPDPRNHSAFTDRTPETLRNMARLIGHWEAECNARSFDDLCAMHIASATKLYERFGVPPEGAIKGGKTQLTLLMEVINYLHSTAGDPNIDPEEGHERHE